MTRSFGSISNSEDGWATYPSSLETAMVTTSISTAGVGNVAITELGFTLSPNYNYIYEAVIFFESTQTFGGLALGIDGPPGAIEVKFAIMMHEGILDFRSNAHESYGNTLRADGVAHANNVKPAFLFACVQNGVNSGILNAVFHAKNGLATLTIQPGSYAKLYIVN